MMTGRDLLVYLSLKYKGNFIKIIEAIKNKETVQEETAMKAVKAISKDVKVLTILDKNYPAGLRNGFQPPLVLYYKGDISLIEDHQPKLAVIGSRECTDYGKTITKKIVSKVGKQNVIVSGLARGIDAVAHKSTLEAEGKTVAVLGCGINYVYPRENEKLYKDIASKGLLISEYPEDTEPKPDNFPARNRIVAGVADKVLVTEAYVNSGTNITVLYALRQGKDVMAVPHEADKQSSCNRLIQDGASLVENAEDVEFMMRDLHKERTVQNHLSRDDNEREVSIQ